MEFNSELWKERAWARYTRAVQSGRAQKIDETNWALDVLAINDLELLVNWCKNHKLKVVFAKKSNGTYYHDDKQITICSNLSPRSQVIVLLHECGHHLIEVQELHERFVLGYSQTDPEITKTFEHRIACLEEEFEAWHRGWKLARRLCLCVDRESFDKYRVKCLRTYIKWSLKPKKFSEVD